MKRNNRIHLAAAIGLLSVGLLAGGAAEACSLAAWSQPFSGQAANPTVGGPDDSFRIFAGGCSMQPVNGATPSYVEESTNHTAEGASSPFSGRFHVYTGISGANPTVFRALSADSGGTTVFDITYDSTNQRFTANVPGVGSESTGNGSAPLNRWVEVRFEYSVANGLRMQTASNTTATNDVHSSIGTAIAAGTSAVERIQFGIVAGGGGTGAIFLDEYEASRAAGGIDIAVPAVCRGDSNNDGNITASDRSAITGFIRGNALPGRRPDCNQDGAITASDRSCVTGLIRLGTACS